MNSQIDTYLNNVEKIKSSKEARKYEFVRLVSFKELPKECLLPVTLVAHIGFFYDPKVRSIRCCECSFHYENLKSPYTTQLVYKHYKFNRNCVNIELQKDLIKNALDKKPQEVEKESQERAQKQMTRKENRLQSLENLDLTINHQKLVENGFYVDNNATISTALVKLRCAFCSYSCIINKNYHLNTRYEDPFEEHRSQSPNCAIIIELNKSDSTDMRNAVIPKVNVNQINEILDSIKSEQPGKSILYNNPDNFDVIKSVLSKTLNAVCDKPFHPGYATEQSRLESFRNWPLTLTQRPDELAKAGFYYYGCKDQVKCFFCNGGLRNWDPTDEPIWEHARWFPKCSYIRQLMGAKFLEEVKERYKDQDSGFTDDFDDNPQYYDLASNDNGPTTNVNRATRAENRPAVNQNQNTNQQQRQQRAPSPRTINSRLDLPAVRKIMELGIKRFTLKQVIERKLKEDGKDYENILDLVKACMKHEENTKRLQEQFKQTIHLYIANMPADVKHDQIKELFKNKFKIDPTIRNYNGIVLISIPEDDLDKLDTIVDELDEKCFPNSKSENKIIVKKTLDQSDIKSMTNKLEFKLDDSKGELVRTESMDVVEPNLTISAKTTGGSMEADELKQEVEKLKKERECVICMERLKNTMFLPCAHLAACVECSVSLPNCPVCRAKVEATVRTYS